MLAKIPCQQAQRTTKPVIAKTEEGEVTITEVETVLRRANIQDLELFVDDLEGRILNLQKKADRLRELIQKMKDF